MSNPHPKTAKDEAPAAKDSGNKNDLAKKENIDLEEQADSGFLSGEQSSFWEDQGEQKQSTASATRGSHENKFNKPTSRNVQSSVHNLAKVEQEFGGIDSGCIEEYEEDGDPTNSDVKAVFQSNTQKNTQSRRQEQQQKVQNSEGRGFNIANTNATYGENMGLKHDVDAHMAERFCNLGLQNAPMNNLNSSSRITTAVAAATTKNTTESNQIPAWEKCYRQNDEGDTYLHLACISGHENVVAALIRLAIHPCLLNIKNDYGQTPLHLASLTKQRRILRMLLLAGAEPCIRDSQGNTALHLACMSGDEQCVNALTIPISASEINEAHRQYGYRSNDKVYSSLSAATLPPDLEIRNYDGEYCVHIAAEAGHINILSTLVQYGADINAREGKGGYTPLHIAVEQGNEDVFKFLMDECKNKLNLETETFGRLTAYQFACICKKINMQSLLENRGAEPLTPPDSEYESSDDDSDFEDSKNYDRFVDSNYFSGYKGGNAMAVM
ncbi:NF-kappa-B inhibitor cactus-like isoform X2 [Eurosta solidaginis]|uniref:NF-kappa-B inhibitor cactus-like isoform X2 n=1 Tax=Eurosta solidaginis TaxID=178769 RepID=UPI0035305A9D